MTDTVSPDARYVTLEGVALAIVVVSPTLLGLSVLAVATRAYVRITENTFAIDDILLIGGLIFYIADVGIAIRAATVGVGTIDARLNEWMDVQAMKFFTIWILVYVVGLALIKSSICTTIWRIAHVRHSMRITVYSLFGLVWASFIVTFVGMLLYCMPIQANWDTSLLLEHKAHCGSIAAMIGISHTATVTTIITDIGCAAVPGLLLWKTQMKAQAKLEVFALMSVASLASISTIARAPFISHYEHPHDNLKYYIGFIVLFSNIESGIGCIATSLPAIRKLYMRLAKKEVSESDSPGNTPKDDTDKTLVTIGGGGSSPFSSRGRKSKVVFTNPTDRGVSLVTVQANSRGDGDWERLGDEEDEIPLSPYQDGRHSKPLGGIRADYTYSVEVEPVK
ncbi:hypothetical protein VM1G_05934 [Cytospora mali]|uniref:Rhodopsin domain-containing protein n=1 Tax=Cytospora mali TaxID=578113 RepID=A0A194W2E2_CYTMA|nr:hypothetical protein VM1G_05934 [Valsa mali]